MGKGWFAISKMSLSFLISSFSYLNHEGRTGEAKTSSLNEMVLEFKLCFFMSIELTWDGDKGFGCM